MSEVDATTAKAAGGVLVATCVSTLVVNANTSAVSILLPAISADTGMAVETLQWAVTGYSLVGAAVIVTSGSSATSSVASGSSSSGSCCSSRRACSSPSPTREGW